VTYTGFINGDTSASLTTQPTVTSTASTASPVQVSPYTITASGAVDPYYTFTYVSGSLAVTPAPLMITADHQSSTYGATLPTLTATYTGLVNNDTASSLTTPPTITTMATAASSVTGSPYAITASGAVDSNYTITYAPGTLAITAAPLLITPDDQTKVYGAALPPLTASYSGFVNNETAANLTTQPNITTTATATSGVTNSPYAITASGAVDSNYAITYAPGSLTVTPVALLITADDQSEVYGSALPTLTASYSGFVNNDTAASLTTQPTLTTASATSPVGTYAITASGAVDSDYTISYMDGTLAITPAPLLITADDQSEVYGSALPTLTASYSGFVNNDTAASLTTQPTITTTATATSGVTNSPYAITASGAVDSNYAITYVPGSLTVTPTPLLITADDESEYFGSALPTLTASYTGFVNGDTAANLTTLPTLSTTASANSPVGPYVITASGAVDPDYTFTYAPGTLTIVPTTITGTVYLDVNANGVLDSGESGLAGRVVFLDLNNDGTLDAGDPTTTTDANGDFTFPSSLTGANVVLEAISQDISDRYVVDQTLTNPDGTVTIGVSLFSPVTPVNVVPNPFSATPSSDAATAYVNSLYLAVLGRTGAASEVESWLVKMNDGMTDQEVALGFVNSPEHRENQVTTYYGEFLHRAPDPASIVWIDDLYIDVLGRDGEASGIASWQADLASGASRVAIEASFVESPEADGQMVQSFYTAFLHRQREPGTTSNGWVNMLEATNGSATDVAVGILASSEFDQDATTPES
jgi:hypothetical protein